MDWLYYVWTTILNKSEKEFWTSTLKKIISQTNIYIELNGGKKEEDDRGEILKVMD
ncbi:MAG: hypothetical protein MSA15_17090 [Clostridium sp.]|nr:hypothetical protein [Clostridium sp.]